MEAQLPDSYFVSEEIDDYENGAYILLNEEQERYHNDHPEVTPLECWNMAPEPEPEPTPEELLWRARDAKRKEIQEKDPYHYYIDDQDAYVSDTLRMKDRCGRMPEVEINGHAYPSAILTVALDEMTDYAEKCGKITNDLFIRIEEAETAEEVEAIEVTGYPEVIHTTTEALRSKGDETARHSPEAQAVAFVRSMVNNVSLTANQALEMQVLFPIWGEKGAEFGKKVSGPKNGLPGFRFQYKAEKAQEYLLYEVIKDHALQADWIPAGQMDLYKVVTVEHAGTLEDPIPYVQGMAFEKDKYYEQYGVTYLCILTTVTGYPNDLKDLPTIVQEVKR